MLSETCTFRWNCCAQNMIERQNKPGFFSEYCTGQRFRAVCLNNEVVVMETALYGRMSLGKCIERNLGFLGCSSSALRHLDNVCSNQNSCEVVVSEIPVATTCPKDVTSYLKASFDCVKGLFFYSFKQYISKEKWSTVHGQPLQHLLILISLGNRSICNK